MLSMAKSDVLKIVMSCVVAGLLNGVLAPFSFSLLGLLVEGKLPDVASVEALVAIVFFASTVGLLTCMIVGVPVLLLLKKLTLTNPVVSCAIGAAFGFMFAVVFFYSRSTYDLSESWPMAIFYIIHGGFSGYLAGWLSQHNKSLNADASEAGAG